MELHASGFNVPDRRAPHAGHSALSLVSIPGGPIGSARLTAASAWGMPRALGTGIDSTSLKSEKRLTRFSTPNLRSGVILPSKLGREGPVLVLMQNA
jgi:hypothetical protein